MDLAPSQSNSPTQNNSENIPLAFLEWLPRFFPDYEIANGLRLTSNGILVEESLTHKILTAYQKWINEIAGEQKNEEKLFRKLFGTASPKLWYALDGKKCLPGFLMPSQIPQDAKLKIPRYPTGLLDPENYLHPRDPIFERLSGTRARLTPHEGLSIELQCGERSYTLNEILLKSFADAIRNSSILSKKHHATGKPLREMFPILQQLLSRVKPASANDTILIPERFKNANDTLLLRSGGLIFIAQTSNRILYCYEHRGKGRRYFIARETGAMKTSGTGEVRGFDGENPRKHCLGKVWSQKMSFHLEIKAFEIYFHQLARTRKMKEKFMQRPSVREVLQSFVPLFRQSVPVNELDILSGISRHRRPYAKYRKSGDWVFVITDKNIVSSCIRIRKGDNGHSPKNRNQRSSKNFRRSR